MFWSVFFFFATTIISGLLRPKPAGRPASQLSEFDAPTVSESRSLPVLMGRDWLDDPNWCWFGDLQIDVIYERGARKYSFFGPRDRIPVGEKFSIGGHLSLCHKLERILAIQAGDVDELLAEGLNITGNTTVTFNKPELFGGEKKGGGIVGPFAFQFGAPTQAPNDYLTAQTGKGIAYRDEVTVVLEHVYMGTSKFLPVISFLGENLRTETNWYPERRAVGSDGDMNPAHQIHEALTNLEWGQMGVPLSEIDDASFRAAADALFEEGFGLTYKIGTSGVSVEDFIFEVCQTIDATVYEDPATGLWSIRLHRDDYDPNTIPVLDGSNSVVERCTIRVPEVTTVVVKYPDRAARRERSTAPDADLAAVELLGGEVVTELSFPGIKRGELATQVAARERAHRTRVLVESSLLVQPSAGRDLRPGMVFRWQPPKLGYDQVMRVLSVSPGPRGQGGIRVLALQTLPIEDSTYAPAPAPGWIDPVQPPAPSPQRLVMESPYQVLVADQLGPDASAVLSVDQGAFLVAAASPGGTASDHEVWSRLGSSGDFALAEAFGDFVGYAELAAGVPASATSLPIQGVLRLDRFQVGRLAALVSTGFTELVLVQATSISAITVARGLVDTVPAAHLAGAKLFSLGDSTTYIDDVRSNGQTMQVRVLPSTPRGRLALSAAPTDSVTFQRRQIRPYPPGDFRFNGDVRPAAVSGLVTVTGVQRNRLTQGAGLVLQSAAGVTHEAGTTYTARWYLNNTLVRTQASLATPTDAFTPASAGSLRVELEAVRDTYTSWQRQSHTCEYTP